MRSLFRYARLSFALFLLAVSAGTAAPDQSGWESLPSGVSTNMKGLHFVTPSNGYVAGEGGALLKTTDGGQTWTALQSTTETHLWAIAFAPSGDLGFAVGDDGLILKTTDGGQTWAVRNSGLKTGIFRSYLFGVFYLDAQRWFIAGGDGETAGGVVLSTQDGGETWVKHPIDAALFVDKCVFTDAQTGYAVGLTMQGGGVIVRTTDGGQTWAVQHTAPSIISSIWCSGPGMCWAVGNEGVIFHTADGSTWTEQYSGTTADLLSVHFSDDHSGAVAGDGGTVLQTVDGGATWTAMNYDIPVFLSAVQDVEGAAIVAVGDGGTIIKAAPLTTVAESDIPMHTAVQLAPTGGSHFGIAVQTPETMPFPLSLALYNAPGAVVGRHTFETPAAVADMSRLTAGVYFYLIRDAGGRVVGRGVVRME